MQHHFDEFLGDWGGVVHAGTHVDFDEPGVEVFVDHKVIAYQFHRALLADDVPLAALNAPNHNILHLLLHYLPLLSAQPFCELPHLPH